VWKDGQLLDTDHLFILASREDQLWARNRTACNEKDMKRSSSGKAAPYHLQLRIVHTAKKWLDLCLLRSVKFMQDAYIQLAA
jgi:hypothetical protein